MRRRHFLYFFSFILCLLACIIPPAIASSEIATGPIDYQRVQSELQQAKAFNIPVRVPKVLVYRNNLASNGKFFATGGLTTDMNGTTTTGYLINILDSPNCRGALSCTIAYVEVTSNTYGKTIEQQFDFINDPQFLSKVRHAPHAAMWVKLDNGQLVYLVPWVDGNAGMGYEQVVWDEAGYRITVALKGGDKDWLLKMVNSAFG